MLPRSTIAAAILLAVACLTWGNAGTTEALGRPPQAATETVSLAAPLVPFYTQPPTNSGQLYQSSRNGTDNDQYVWDDFVLAQSRSITEIRWRGGFDPSHLGSGGPVLDFRVAIYASVANQPNVPNPPLVEYVTSDNAGETPAGTYGGVAMYDYHFSLPTPFPANGGTMYWVQIEASQNGVPDWGLAAGDGGDGVYFRQIAVVGDIFYQRRPGDAAFSLLGPGRSIFLPLVLRQ